MSSIDNLNILQRSGMSAVIGQQLAVLQGLPLVALILVVVCLVAALTLVTSNTATANLILPILSELVSYLH